MIEAEDVCRLYSHYRKMQHGKYRPSPRWKGVWQKVADQLNRLEIPLDRFLEAQFRTVSPFPMPNMLCGENAVARYRSFADGGDELDYVRRLNYEVDYVRSRQKFMAMDRILAEEPSTLSPAFRYCMALRHGLTELAERLERSAREQLGTSRRYRELYRSFLPEDFMEQWSNE